MAETPERQEADDPEAPRTDYRPADQHEYGMRGTIIPSGRDKAHGGGSEGFDPAKPMPQTVLITDRHGQNPKTVHISTEALDEVRRHNSNLQGRRPITVVEAAEMLEKQEVEARSAAAAQPSVTPPPGYVVPQALPGGAQVKESEIKQQVDPAQFGLYGAPAADPRGSSPAPPAPSAPNVPSTDLIRQQLGPAAVGESAATVEQRGGHSYQPPRNAVVTFRGAFGELRVVYDCVIRENLFLILISSKTTGSQYTPPRTNEELEVDWEASTFVCRFVDSYSLPNGDIHHVFLVLNS